MKNDNSSCSGDSDPLPHCKPDSCRPQVDLTQIIKSVFFCPRRTVQHTKSPLFNLVREPSCPTTGWKQTKAWHIKSVQIHPSTSKCLIIKLILPAQGLVWCWIWWRTTADFSHGGDTDTSWDEDAIYWWFNLPGFRYRKRNVKSSNTAWSCYLWFEIYEPSLQL